MSTMKQDTHWLIIGNPYPYGGGGRHALEVLKHLSSLGIRPILYTPYTDLLFTVSLDLMHNKGVIKDVPRCLEELERHDVIVPHILYHIIEKVGKDPWNHLKSLLGKRGITGALHYLYNSLKSFGGDKINILKSKDFVSKTSHSEFRYLEKISVVYSMHEISSTVFVGAFLSSLLRKKFFILLQLEPFRSLKEDINGEWLFRVRISKQNELKELLRLLILLLQRSVLSNNKFSYEYAFMSKTLKGLLAVSTAPLVVSGIDSWARDRGIGVEIVRPGNAVDQEISSYADETFRRSLLAKKEDVAVYFCRLNPMKGLFEIPFIAKKLNALGYELLIAGRFEKTSDREMFFRICKAKGINNIRYLGWLPRDELFENLAKAKVLIYPSHSDAFPLVVLEALFLGCSVVAYDIPAIKSVYDGLKTVKIVREYDCIKMAEEAIKVLKRDITKHEEEHLDEDFLNFLKLHSSWKNVARAEVESINKILGS